MNLRIEPPSSKWAALRGRPDRLLSGGIVSARFFTRNEREATELVSRIEETSPDYACSIPPEPALIALKLERRQSRIGTLVAFCNTTIFEYCNNSSLALNQ